MWYLESKTIDGKVNLFFNLVPEKTDDWIHEVALFVVLWQVYPRGNAKLLGRTRENSLIQRGLGGIALENRGGEEQSSNSLSFSPFPPPLSRSSCLAMAWFHAKRCFHGAVISFSQRTYNPLPFLLTLRVLSSTRPLSCRSPPPRARIPALLLSPLSLSKVHAKRAVSFTSFSSFDCILSTSEAHYFIGDVVRDALSRINRLNCVF